MDQAKEMAAHSDTLAWKTPWMEEPGRLQSKGTQSRTRLSNFTSLQANGTVQAACVGSWQVCCCCLVTKLCLTLCGHMDNSPSGSSVHGIFQTRILVWVAISFSNPARAVQSLSCVRDFATPWTAACQASLSTTNSRSLLKLMSI